jgi:hypothetical protein
MYPKFLIRLRDVLHDSKEDLPSASCKLYHYILLIVYSCHVKSNVGRRTIHHIAVGCSTGESLFPEVGSPDEMPRVGGASL